MNEPEKSDSAIVAVKLANKAEQSAAELVEPRAGTKGNADQQRTRRAQNRGNVSQALDRVRKVARERKKEKFTTLLHHVDVAMLETAFYALKRAAAPGVDGMTWKTYEQDLDRRIEDLHARVHRGAYRALPSRRSYIPKDDGSKRPLAVAALEDKIVQKAVATVLSEIYEEDFLGFSYGFRPDRGQHDALDALIVGITSKKVNFILDADIRSFFTEVSQQWVVRFLEHRIGDPRIIRLVQKWLRAGVLEDGIVTVEEKGTGQGSVISPLLSNVYLHYVFDLWADRWRRREATGDMIMVRYADDIIVGFQHESDARRFWNDMRDRLGEFSLSLHSDKTRLIEFGRFAAQNCEKRGRSGPETFKFLGFVLICDKSRGGVFRVRRKSRRDRMRATLRDIKEALRRRINRPIPETGKWLASVVSGYFAYHAVPTNGLALAAFRRHVIVIWHRQLARRSQRARVPWERMAKLADEYLPKPRILHPWPNVRFAARHPR
ncbi:group II intron reverse transcriptase/maturase [Methylocystis sp. NLS-7]|nr:group II intron reverse transcriptase/maturase [Methylocystis suflitae]MCQ4191039.1 group II intron reverse transcriptase/maturase [Methylocystis suflitae]